jgi:chorismate mutase
MSSTREEKKRPCSEEETTATTNKKSKESEGEQQLPEAVVSKNFTSEDDDSDDYSGEAPPDRDQLLKMLAKLTLNKYSSEKAVGVLSDIIKWLSNVRFRTAFQQIGGFYQILALVTHNMHIKSVLDECFRVLFHLQLLSQEKLLTNFADIKTCILASEEYSSERLSNDDIVSLIHIWYLLKKNAPSAATSRDEKITVLLAAIEVLKKILPDDYDTEILVNYICIAIKSIFTNVDPNGPLCSRLKQSKFGTNFLNAAAGFSNDKVLSTIFVLQKADIIDTDDQLQKVIPFCIKLVKDDTYFSEDVSCIIENVVDVCDKREIQKTGIIAALGSFYESDYQPPREIISLMKKIVE